ncbi:hypothetical protein F975_02027 [Acinetobacter sp. ANC 3789]|nr:hypothetical protein F975_02027 [Acinetobacter sp. ANC 3789]
MQIKKTWEKSALNYEIQTNKFYKEDVLVSDKRVMQF